MGTKDKVKGTGVWYAFELNRKMKDGGEGTKKREEKEEEEAGGAKE